MNNPYRPPQAELRVPQNTRSYYGGLRRLPYFLWQLGMSVAAFVIIFAVAASSAGTTGNFDPAGGLVMFLLVVATIAGFVLAGHRFKNQGSNPWMCLLQLIPIVNIYVGWRLFVCQEGYADEGRLDTTGKVLTWIFFGLIALAFVAAFLAEPSTSYRY